MSMEIKGTSNVDRAVLRRTARKDSSGSTFSLSTPEEPQSQAVSSSGPLAALDSILALQEMEDATDGRSKGLKHGEELLDMLDQIRDGLLAGGIPRDTLSRLSRAIAKRQDGFSDPQLQGVLDEIDLRAQVELAKLEMSEKGAS